ncbi:MAG: hypothetical protein JXA94_05745 [Parachlamydiales bacterium]|nr:hypothetical protein [Parachlamydiales bacterium]
MSPDNKKKLITYGMYNNFIKEIKHYDNLQTQFRLLSSTVLLGSLAAIGFLFSVKQLNIPFARSFAALIVGIIGITALFTLWHIDIKYYEKLLVSHFAEAFKLEKENDWLPKVHHNMVYKEHKKDHPSNVAYYYIGCIITLTLTLGCTVSWVIYKIHNLLMHSILTITLTVFFIIIFFVILKKKSDRISDLLKKLHYMD